jgi:hypothetical protein
MANHLLDVSGISGEVKEARIVDGQTSGNLLFSSIAALVSGMMIVGNLLISRQFLVPLTGAEIATLMTVFFNSAGELVLSRALMTESWRRKQSTLTLGYMYILLIGMYAYDFMSNLTVLGDRAISAGYETTLSSIAVVAVSFLLCFSEWFFLLSWQFFTHDWKTWYDSRYKSSAPKPDDLHMAPPRPMPKRP